MLRRILRRAVRYGRALGFTEPFFYKLAAVLARTMGDVFPEIRERQEYVQETLRREEEAFNRRWTRALPSSKRRSQKSGERTRRPSPARLPSGFMMSRASRSISPS